jgi:hypothetical protein
MSADEPCAPGYARALEPVQQMRTAGPAAPPVTTR